MTITSVVFYLLSILGIISGVLTIIMGKKPINSVVYLVTCFGNYAAIFILMGINLIGYIYIIVYVGAIAILFIFVIMMMDLRNLTESTFQKDGYKNITKYNINNNISSPFPQSGTRRGSSIILDKGKESTGENFTNWNKIPYFSGGDGKGSISNYNYPLVLIITISTLSIMIIEKNIGLFSSGRRK